MAASAKMWTVEELTVETFAGQVGETFLMRADEETTHPLRLLEANDLRDRYGKREGRPPFSLLFLGPQSPIMPQGTYRLANEALGEVDVFLVPIGQVAEGIHYEAAFS